MVTWTAGLTDPVVAFKSPKSPSTSCQLPSLQVWLGLWLVECAVHLLDCTPWAKAAERSLDANYHYAPCRRVLSSPALCDWTQEGGFRDFSVPREVAHQGNLCKFCLSPAFGIRSDSS